MTSYASLPLQQDAFSHILDILRLRGTSVMATALIQGQYKAFKQSTPCIYVVQSGELIIEHSSQTLKAQAGDVVLLVHGGTHKIQAVSDLEDSSVPATQYLRGEFTFDNVFADRFLHVLPEIIILKKPVDKPYEWVDLSCNFILDEVMQGLAGSTAMVSRLLDLLFVRTLRTWASEQVVGHGWVSGAVDSRIGKALNALQQNPQNNWSLESLAATAHLSRTAFSNRFFAVVGQTPIAYLNTWRLDYAASRLKQHKLTMSELITLVGYTSEAAFSRAFKLRYGLSPIQWGKEHRHTGEAMLYIV